MLPSWSKQSKHKSSIYEFYIISYDFARLRTRPNPVCANAACPPAQGKAETKGSRNQMKSASSSSQIAVLTAKPMPGTQLNSCFFHNFDNWVSQIHRFQTFFHGSSNHVTSRLTRPSLQAVKHKASNLRLLCLDYKVWHYRPQVVRN